MPKVKKKKKKQKNKKNKKTKKTKNKKQKTKNKQHATCYINLCYYYLIPFFLSLVFLSFSLLVSSLSSIFHLSISPFSLYSSFSPRWTTKVIFDFCSNSANPSLHHIKFLTGLKFDSIWVMLVVVILGVVAIVTRWWLT